MIPPHTLLLRLIGPMQAWGYRSRFEDRDTSLEPTRSGVLGLVASAAGLPRHDIESLARWDASLRYGVRAEVPVGTRYYDRSAAPTGFRVEADYHTAQDVYRASGSGRAETVLSTRRYLADARYTAGLESSDLGLLRELEAALKNPRWTLCLGRKAFPLSVPPWLREGGIRESTSLVAALKSAPWLLLQERETLPQEVTFVVEPGSDCPAGAIPIRLPDRPLDFADRQFGIREAAMFRLSTGECGMEVDRCISRR